MKVDPVNLGLQIIDEIGKEIAQDAAEYMKKVAPSPSGKATGPGSESTGALQRSIRYWDISFGDGNPRYFVGPAGNTLGNDGLPIKDYAEFADQGRGPISVPPQGTRQAMAFKPKHPKSPHVKPDGFVITHEVGPMEGWNYIEQTYNYIKEKYGGK